MHQMTIKDVLDNTWFAYRNHFTKLLLYCMVFAGIFSLFSVVIQRLFMPDWMLPFQDIFTAISPDAGGIPIPSEDVFLQDFSMMMLGVYLVSISKGILDILIIQPFIQGGITQMVSRDLHGIKLGFKKMTQFASKKYGKLLLLQLSQVCYYLIAMSVLGIVFSVIMFASPFLISPLSGLAVSGQAGSVIFIIIVALLLFVFFVAILLAIVFVQSLVIFAYPIAVNQNQWGFKAIFESMALVWKCRWRVVFSMALVNIAAMLAYMAFGGMSNIFSLVVPQATFIFSGLTSVLSDILIMPYVAIATTLLYYDIRVRKTGYDLDLRLIQLQKNKMRGSV